MTLISRSPVVVVLGHVDHGKTTLLDFIRKSNVALKEEGAITQKIGAYVAKTVIKGYPVSEITFIDTPGHEAFSKIRSRGATVADIAILLIDGVESVKPQTIESIAILKQSKIPFVVALNKMDLPNFSPEKVKKDLLRYEIMVEGFGGSTPVIPISAKTGSGVQDLLEAILFISAERKLVGDKSGELEVYVIEVNITKAGIAVSAIIKNGSLTIGDMVFSNNEQAKIKSLVNDAGERIQTVIPSMPFTLLGFTKAPQVGDRLKTTFFEGKKEEIVQKSNIATLENLLDAPDEKKKLLVIVKADNQGSLEAISDMLSTHESIIIEQSGIGEVSRSDVFRAKVTGAIIFNFNQPIGKDVVQIAKDEKILIRTYSLIYKLFEELEDVLEFMKEKDEKLSRFKGQAKIVANFLIDSQPIAGISVLTGKIAVDMELEIYHGETLIGTTRVQSLQQKTKTVKEIKKNEEGGLAILPQLDFKVGDMIKSYSI